MMPKGVDRSSMEELAALLKKGAHDESTRVVGAVKDVKVDEFLADLTSKLDDSFRENTDYWKKTIPGKRLLSEFAHAEPKSQSTD